MIPPDTRPECVRCSDHGWIELHGNDQDGYPRGATGCLWCDKGRGILRRNPKYTQHYTAADVDTPVWMPPGKTSETTKEAA